MQGGIRAIFSHGNVFKNAVLSHIRVGPLAMRPLIARHESTSTARMEEHGFESTTISDVLKSKGKSADGSWLWCATEDSVYDAVKSATCKEEFEQSSHMATHIRVGPLAMRPLIARHESTSTARMEEHGFESTTISDVLKSKGKSADGSWLWCSTEDSVYDAVKSMTQHNVGALVVVKPGEQRSIAGIITERGSSLYTPKLLTFWIFIVLFIHIIIVQGRSSNSTKVGDIMTEENKLITVTPDTKVLKAMQLMTDNRIRHIPVINDTGMIGMVSIGDVVRAVVSEHRDELNRLNAFIQGGY
ncbi:hypothetical protein CDL12_12718 [Handroanthus impetiginosus]|uniref:CBS domain-containing protein n=1 Tax=Handroanthus impetiginosus TaxID=429701 RepID=A0A2G9HAV0_9LAMI|nr:hypothetical protein CDL12_12718 [Handroanthus impetiginosus]